MTRVITEEPTHARHFPWQSYAITPLSPK